MIQQLIFKITLMIFIALLAYLTCTPYQQNNYPLVSTDGHDIRTVMKDLAKLIQIDYPDLYDKMKNEDVFERNTDDSEEADIKIGDNELPERANIRTRDNELPERANIRTRDNELPERDNIRTRDNELPERANINIGDNELLERVYIRNTDKKINKKDHRKTLIDPYPKKNTRIVERVDNNDFQYVEEEDGRIFLVLN